MRPILFITKFSLLLCCLNPAFAGIQSHESLQATAMSFLQAETRDIEDSSITIRPFDKRLRLHQCSTALEAFWPLANKKLGSTTVGIRCDGNKPWKIYAGAHIHIYKYVWSAKTALSRNQILSAEELQQERRDITKLSAGYISVDKPILGMQTKRNIQANQVLTNNMLALEKMMKRGDRITIISKYAGVEVRANGIAMTDGSKGERIRVKNISSNREIEAYVSDKHMVSVTL